MALPLFIDTSEKDTSEKLQVDTKTLPSLSADLNPEFIEKEKQERKEKRRKSVLANLIGTDKAARKWRKPGALDRSYADELRRLELAEERRKKQMEMFDRLKNRKMSVLGEAFDDGSPRFEDCKSTFLNPKHAKYLNRTYPSFNLDYKYIFQLKTGNNADMIRLQ